MFEMRLEVLKKSRQRNSAVLSVDVQEDCAHEGCRHLKTQSVIGRFVPMPMLRFPIRWLIALERGKVEDLSLPQFARLIKGSGSDTGDYERS